LDTANGYFEQRIEIYTPPYLYNGPRPRLTAGPQQLTRGGTAVFSTPGAAEIASARLMRPSAVTHVTDLEQRSIALGVRRTASAVALTVPSSAGLVPPGWYMLFVTNRQGSPSIARWVHVG
ncbi:MAG: galactose oxidase early set domain-containing protein, partial [Solirubrobacteraceae bacterium]